MEDSKSALDSFMNFQSESVSAQVNAGGPSYLALIKSRYASTAEVPEQTSKPQASVAFEAWQEDFMSSNNLLLSDMEHSHQHCEHSHSHPTDAEVLDIEDEGLEQITLVSSPLAASSMETLSRMSNKLKVNTFLARTSPPTTHPHDNSSLALCDQVDNFYIDGESDAVEDLDLCGYMPSGLNTSSALADETSDTESSNSDEAGHNADKHYADYSDLANILHDVEVATLETRDTELQTDTGGNSGAENTSNGMALLQRAYQAEQRRIVETLSCSESDDEHSDCDHDTTITNHTDLSSTNHTVPNATNVDIEDDTYTPVNMTEALAEFQKYSARYRDINSTDLLNSINVQSFTTANTNANTDEHHEVGERWYDDVEDFVQED